MANPQLHPVPISALPLLDMIVPDAHVPVLHEGVTYQISMENLLGGIAVGQAAAEAAAAAAAASAAAALTSENNAETAETAAELAETNAETALAAAIVARDAALAAQAAAEAAAASVGDASTIDFTPAGNLASTDVQAALEELDAEKAAVGHNHNGVYEPVDATILRAAQIGSIVQAWDAQLDEWATVDPSTDGKALVEAANYAAMRALLDLEAGTDFLSPAAIAAAYQPLHANLTEWATLNPSADAGSLVTAADYAAMRTLLGLVIGTNVQAFDADILFADVSDVLGVGFPATSDNDGTQSSGTYTPTPVTGHFKHITANGAFTLAVPTVGDSYTLIICVTNGASAGAITTSGYTKVTGDAYVTTNGFDFYFYITKHNGFSHLHITALQ